MRATPFRAWPVISTEYDPELATGGSQLKAPFEPFVPSRCQVVDWKTPCPVPVTSPYPSTRKEEVKRPL